MTSLARVRCTWTGFPGAPGVSTFYWGGVLLSNPELDNLSTFFDGVKSKLPVGIKITVENAGDVIHDGTGEINGTWSAPGGGTVTATGQGVFPGPAGAAVNWGTDGVNANRRIRGRTYLVPMTSSALGGQGKLLGSTMTEIETAASALVSSGDTGWCIWSPPNATRAGYYGRINQRTVPDKVVVLRSRRD